jgi:hypothetical protein
MVYDGDDRGVTALESTSFDALGLIEADIEEQIIGTSSILGKTYSWSRSITPSLT